MTRDPSRRAMSLGSAGSVGPLKETKNDSSTSISSRHSVGKTPPPHGVFCGEDTMACFASVLRTLLGDGPPQIVLRPNSLGAHLGRVHAYELAVWINALLVSVSVGKCFGALVPSLQGSSDLTSSLLSIQTILSLPNPRTFTYWYESSPSRDEGFRLAGGNAIHAILLPHVQYRQCALWHVG